MLNAPTLIYSVMDTSLSHVHHVLYQVVCILLRVGHMADQAQRVTLLFARQHQYTVPYGPDSCSQNSTWSTPAFALCATAESCSEFCSAASHMCRMLFGFSRDQAVPFWWVWQRVDHSTGVPYCAGAHLLALA